MKLLQTQDQLNTLVDLFDDEHCFVRECHVISPSYIKQDNLATVAADSLPGVRVWITSSCRESPGLELLLYDLKRLNLDFELPFALQGTVAPDEVLLSFSRSGNPTLIAKICHYQVLGVESFGSELRFGYESIYDGGGFSIL